MNLAHNNVKTIWKLCPLIPTMEDIDYYLVLDFAYIIGEGRTINSFRDSANAVMLHFYYALFTYVNPRSFKFDLMFQTVYQVQVGKITEASR